MESLSLIWHNYSVTTFEHLEVATNVSNCLTSMVGFYLQHNYIIAIAIDLEYLKLMFMKFYGVFV